MIKWLKAILPEGSPERLERLKDRLQLPLLFLASKLELLAALYYAFFSMTFWREHKAVISGRLRYLRDQGNPLTIKYVLRRNTHRLEKGLLMRPRRPVFALAYIEQTFEAYNLARTDPSPHPGIVRREELEWCSAVLTQYFEVTGSHPLIDRLREKFDPMEATQADRAPVAAPYLRDLEAPAEVAFDDLLQLARRRRSVRWFQPKPVPRELIDQAIEVAALSPSACNRQPFEFRIFDDPELVPKIASIPMGTSGFSHNFPAVAVVIGKLSAFFSERDRHVIYIDASLSVMALAFALETLGLSSCCINWPDIQIKERAMAKAIGLEADERVIMLMAFGYPDPGGMVAYSQKKPIDELRSYNRIRK